MSSEQLPYRLLTGPDTVEFCRRVSDALADGYRLHGSPSITFDPERNAPVVAQALVLDTESHSGTRAEPGASR